MKKTSIEDYITICQLGRGSYGDVVLAKQKSNDKEYAIKIINKRFMAKVFITFYEIRKKSSIKST